MHTLVREDALASNLRIKRLGRTRVLTLRPFALTWRLPLSRLNLIPCEVLRNMERLTFELSFIETANEVAWPSSLKEVTIVQTFDPMIDVVAWPKSIQKLTFGPEFDQAIDKVVWPLSLQQPFLETVLIRQSTRLRSQRPSRSSPSG